MVYVCCFGRWLIWWCCLGTCSLWAAYFAYVGGVVRLLCVGFVLSWLFLVCDCVCVLGVRYFWRVALVDCLLGVV